MELKHEMKFYRFIDWKNKVIELAEGDINCALVRNSLSAIKEKWNIIDAGAGVGFYTINMAIKVKKGRVFAFECHPDTMKVLQKNLELHNLKNVTTIQKALTDKYREKTHLWETSSYTGTFVRRDKSGILRAYLGKYKRKLLRQKETRHAGFVETETIDNFRNNRRLKIHMIKMDIQGMEEKALLKGSYETLTTDKPMLLIEVHSLTNKKHFLEVLRQLGYSLTTELESTDLPAPLVVKGENKQ